MSKTKKQLAKANGNKTELGRGEIKDNFLAALVTSKVYKMQIVKPKKAKALINVKLKI